MINYFNLCSLLKQWMHNNYEWHIHFRIIFKRTKVGQCTEYLPKKNYCPWPMVMMNFKYITKMVLTEFLESLILDWLMLAGNKDCFFGVTQSLQNEVFLLLEWVFCCMLWMTGFSAFFLFAVFLLWCKDLCDFSVLTWYEVICLSWEDVMSLAIIFFNFFWSVILVCKNSIEIRSYSLIKKICKKCMLTSFSLFENIWVDSLPNLEISQDHTSWWYHQTQTVSLQAHTPKVLSGLNVFSF